MIPGSNTLDGAPESTESRYCHARSRRDPLLSGISGAPGAGSAGPRPHHANLGRRLRFEGDARHSPALDPGRRPAVARRRSIDLRDGPARAPPALGDPGGAPGHLGRDDDRRRPPRPGARLPRAQADGTRRDRGGRRGEGARDGPRSLGERPDRHPVRPGQQRRRRVRGRSPPRARGRDRDRCDRGRRRSPARRILGP